MSDRAVVVGGGIVGLATALSLAERGLQVTVLEAESRLAMHQTSHNSGVVHSGLYYRPGSRKARLCTAGREALYRFAEAEGVPHRRCGKVVVAVSEEEIPRLDELERRGRANGLVGLERLGRRELSERHPGVAGVAALWVPQTGIVDFRQVARALARRLGAAGGEVRTGSRVLGIRPPAGRRWRILLETPSGSVECSLLVNCAGLQSDRVARLAGIDPDVRIVPFRGEYWDVASEVEGTAGGSETGVPVPSRVPVPVYPVPDPRFPFLGVHLTPTVDGRVEAGPNAVLAFHRHGYRLSKASARDLWEVVSFPGFWRLLSEHWRYAARELRRSVSKGAFLDAVRRLVPEIEGRHLTRGGAGVRAQALDREGNLVDDFRFAEAERQLHVLNAPSPAATAALAIGEEISGRAVASLG